MNRKPDPRQNPCRVRAACTLVVLACSAGCMVGPKYQRPPAPVPPAFREAPPAGWKEAHPDDGALRGKWWEMYGDPTLNSIEEQVSVSNQNVLAAEALLRAARDSVHAARAALYPTVSAGASLSNARTSSAGGSRFQGSAVRSVVEFPVVDFAYQADVWGSIRRSIQASAESAQISAAQLENARLTIQAQLASDYFEMCGIDGDIQLLQQTVKSYQEYLELTRNRFAGGVASAADVAQAETQVDTARVQLTDLGVARAQFEHAVALLTGRAPAEVTIAPHVLTQPPPPIPVALPSTLLERRPDIAAAERQMAVQNEQIGIAQAAFYPSVSISASAGLQGSSFTNLMSWPARFWSVGPSVTQLLFDAGRRRAVVKQQQDLFDATVASYRQTVLTGMQQVEDALSTLRILEGETEQARFAVESARHSLDLSTAQYKAGVVSYLQVLTAQTFVLQNQRTSVDLLTRRLTASVQLIEALGGGWNASQLPSIDSLKARSD